MRRGVDQPPLLVHADACRGGGKLATTPRPHLDEHEGPIVALAIAHHEIDLAAPAHEVTRDEPHALTLQILQRPLLERISDCFRHAASPLVIALRVAQWRPAALCRLASLLMTPLSELANGQHYPTGALYVVATPIGNVADITVRALHVLGLVDRVAAEDTRNTSQLLARYGISKPTIAVHEHNERSAAEHVIAHLRHGERIACVSDAGTPGISDPGAKLVDAVRDAGFPVIPLPGASALTTALSAAGAWVHTFSFIGFLATKSKQRATQLQALRNHTAALVFYEAPHRIVETVQALGDAFGGDRQLLIARELTKLHESIHRCTLAEGPTWLAGDANRQRGEFVLVVEGARIEVAAEDAHDPLLVSLLEELSVSSAARLAATLTGASRNTLYTRALELAKAQESRDP
jgi:16S rRNA (cytidine1402-2'-O)-methyltransferase